MATPTSHGLEQARANLPRLAAQANAGKASLITRHGKPYAAIVPVTALSARGRGSLLGLRGSGKRLWGRSAGKAIDALRREWDWSAVARMARAHGTSPAPDWQAIPAGAKVVVDSAPIIYLLEDHRTFAPRFAGLFEAEAEGRVHVAISSLTIAEVLTGPYKHGEEALARRYEKALHEFEVVPVDATIAVAASRLRVRYGLKLPDAIQLATALETGAYALVTHDRDFSKVQGMRIL